MNFLIASIDGVGVCYQPNPLLPAVSLRPRSMLIDVAVLVADVLLLISFTTNQMVKSSQFTFLPRSSDLYVGLPHI